MPDYRRAWCPGGTYFFTANILRCHDNDLLTRHVDVLRVRWGQVPNVILYHSQLGGIAGSSALRDRAARAWGGLFNARNG